MQRNHPFGYQIENGNITVNDKEQELLIEIFTRYSQGESYQKITDVVNDIGIPYHEEKENWNKNIIARLLVNTKYLGNEKYPRLIEESLFIKVARQRNSKSNLNPKATKEMKTIKEMLYCEKCGGKIQKRIGGDGRERWYCENDLTHISTKVKAETIETAFKNAIANHQIKTTKIELPTDTDCINKLTAEIQKLLAHGNNDIEFMQALINNVAQKRYENCQSHTGHQMLKRKLLKELQSSTTLNVPKLKQLITHIAMSYDGTLTLMERSS